MASSNKNEAIKIKCFACRSCLLKFLLSSNLVATSAEEMKSTLIDVLLNVLLSDLDELLLKDALVPSNEPVNLSVFIQQPINNVVTSGTLPAIEAHSYPHVSSLIGFGLAKCNDLMAPLGDEGVVSLNCYFQLFRLEFELLAEDKAWRIIQNWRVVNSVFDDSSSEIVQVSVGNHCERLIFLFVAGLWPSNVKLVSSRGDGKVRLGLREFILRRGYQIEEVPQGPLISLRNIQCEKRSFEFD